MINKNCTIKTDTALAFVIIGLSKPQYTLPIEAHTYAIIIIFKNGIVLAGIYGILEILNGKL